MALVSPMRGCELQLQLNERLTKIDNFNLVMPSAKGGSVGVGLTVAVQGGWWLVVVIGRSPLNEGCARRWFCLVLSSAPLPGSGGGWLFR